MAQNQKSQIGKSDGELSYFSDFILMQQLMTVEIDIIVGHTKNNIKYLHVTKDKMMRGPRNKESESQPWGDAIEKEHLLNFKAGLSDIEPSSNRAKLEAI